MTTDEEVPVMDKQLSNTPLDTTVRPCMSLGVISVGGSVSETGIRTVSPVFCGSTGDVRLRAADAPAFATIKGLHVGARAWSPPV